MCEIIQFPTRRFVTFYPEPIQCDYCHAITKCRVYEDSKEIVCGNCGIPIFEFEYTDPEIIFTPDEVQ